MAVVFVDVFFIYNFIINLILLITTKLISFSKTKNINLVIGAFIGSVYAVIIMMFKINSFLNWILNPLAMCAVVYVSFRTKILKAFLKNLAVFFVSSMIYGGTMFFVMYFFKTGIHFGGGIFYVNVSVPILILIAVLCYGVVYAAKHIIEKKLLFNGRICTLEIGISGKKIETSALYDTGNCLFEPISGAPVIFAEESLFSDVCLNLSTYRAIPYKSAGGSGILMAFVPDYVKINNKNVEILVYVAFYGGILSKENEYHAVLHPFSMPHIAKGDMSSVSQKT